MKSAVLLASLLALALPAFAQTDTSALPKPVVAETQLTSQDPAAATGDADKGKVCRNERPIGSNRAKRVCRTREQIRMESEMSRDSVVEVGRRRDSASGSD